MYKEATRCRICGNDSLDEILSLGVQTLTGTFPRSRDEKITSGPVDLLKCNSSTGCGLVQLRQSYDLAEMYGLNYGYRSGLNRSMVAHLHGKVAKILADNHLRDGDLVIDIGSNDATTLRAYPVGRFELVGIDPTGVKFASYYPKEIRLIADFFSAAAVSRACAGRKAKVITSFSMFYDLESPVTFATEIAGALDINGIWHCEQSYLPTMLRTNSFDTICHEHLEFYGLKQIMWIARASGLKILDVEFNDVNGGSFSFTAARSDSSHLPNVAHLNSILADEIALGLDGVEAFATFRENMLEAKMSLLKFLRTAKEEGKRVFGLGASTKGNVLLQYCGIGPDLLCKIGEVNADKFGSYTPGTLIPLVSEDEVLSERPDYLLVLPWHFRKFFLELPKMRGVKLVFPLPSLQIVEGRGT
jgi:NDP-4-keto-2,6-dideoxyhexose 3-C-methyltransferase